MGTFADADASDPLMMYGDEDYKEKFAEHTGNAKYSSGIIAVYIFKTGNDRASW